LPIVTRFERPKVTAQVKVRPSAPTFLTSGLSERAECAGYEIHMGRIEQDDGSESAFRIVTRNGEATSFSDGSLSPGGAVVGTMIHGILDNAEVRTSLLQSLRQRRGIHPIEPRLAPPTRHDDFDRLAAVLRENLNLAWLRGMVGAR
jgi:adenosylcobyric acid synthase